MASTGRSCLSYRSYVDHQTAILCSNQRNMSSPLLTLSIQTGHDEHELQPVG